MFSLLKNGFTLVELIICIAIIAIIASFAVPYLYDHLAQQEAKKSQALLRQSIKLARQSASLHRSNVVICPTQNQISCTTNNWNYGLMIFIDQNKNRQFDQHELLIESHMLLLKYGQLAWKGTLNLPSLSFQAHDGLPLGSNGSFYYCSNHQYHYRLIMSKMSNVRVEYPQNCSV